MLCQFQMYSKVIQFYTHVTFFFFFKFFSHLDCYIALHRIPAWNRHVHTVIAFKCIRYFYFCSPQLSAFLFVLYPLLMISGGVVDPVCMLTNFISAKSCLLLNPYFELFLKYLCLSKISISNWFFCITTSFQVSL